MIKEKPKNSVLHIIALNFYVSQKLDMIEMLKTAVCTEGEVETGLL